MRPLSMFSLLRFAASLGANKLGEGFCIQQSAKSPKWDLECGDRILGQDHYFIAVVPFGDCSGDSSVCERPIH